MNLRTCREVSAIWQALGLEEIDELQRLARLLPSNPVAVNIGAGAGTSSLALCEARDDIKVWSVDVGISNAERENGCDFVSQGRLLQSGDRSLPFAERYLGYQPDGRLDMVFIDGDHSYEGCSDDIAIWRKLLNIDGYMAIHDYNPPYFPGVCQAVDELMQNPGNLEFVSAVHITRVFQRVGM